MTIFNSLASTRDSGLVRRFVAALTLVFAITLVSPAQPAAAPVREPDLQPRFNVGQVSRYDITESHDESMTAIVPGVPANTSSRHTEITGRISWTVERANADGSGDCLMTIDWMTVDMTDDQNKVERNDSRKTTGDNKEVHEFLSAITGTSMKFHVAADGTIESVAGADAIIRKLPADTNLEELDFIEDASDLATLPGAPKSATRGKSWDESYSWSHELGRINLDMRYQLDSVEEIAGIPIATVSGASTRSSLTVDRSKLPKDAPAMEARLAGGKVSTQILFDLSRHEAVGRHSAGSRQIEMKIPVGDVTVINRITQSTRSQVIRVAEK